MALYRGVLHKVSSGSEVMTQARTYSGGQLVSSYQRGTGLMRRNFIEIGDQHVKNVVLSGYHDSLLEDAIGQEIQLSTVNPFGISRFHRVISFRRPSGQVDKPGFFGTLFTLVLTTVGWWFLAVVVGGILFLMGTGIKLAPLMLIAIGIFLFMVVWPLISAVRIARAWVAQ